VPRNDPPRLAVLGAGPIGLEAALYARSLQLPVTVYERGRVGEHLRRWGHVRLFSPFGMNATPLGRAALLADKSRPELPADGDCITGREHVARYLEPLTQSAALRDSLRPGVQVVQLGRRELLRDDLPGDARRAQQPFRLLLRDAKGRETIEEADVVLDCTGTYGRHRWLGEGGIPAAGEIAAEAQIMYGLPDVLGEKKADYAGRSVLVVGGGFSAATTVCHLATLGEQNGSTWVVWLARGGNSQPIKRMPADPLRERDRLAVRANTLATRGEGNVEFHAHSAVQSVEWLGPDKGFKVTARCAGRTRTWDVERVVGNVGYAPDLGLHRELHVPEGSVGAAQRAAEPNFYVLGAKSYGRNSSFLLRNGFAQMREVFALITGKPDLDLYGKGR
jgi:thioredoxin reductase